LTARGLVPNPSATLNLTRGAAAFQRHPFEILVDGTVVGSVSRRETVEE
jgi:hypothetical protein